MLRWIVTLGLACPPINAAAAWTVRPSAPEPYSLLTGYALTLTTLGLRRPLVDDLQAYESRTRPLKQYSKIGDYAGQLIPNVLYVGGALIAAELGHPRAAHRAQVMTMGTAEAALLTTAIKLVVREERPNHSSRNSFPSGHSTTIFAFAAVVQAEHGWTYGVPAFLLAGFTGFSRINDNMHYLHDVLAGATIGLSFGLGVARANRVLEDHATFVSPLFFDEGRGVGLQAASSF